MKKFVFFAIFILSFLIKAKTSACDLPKGEKIRIGCSYECHFFYRFRLNLQANLLGYRLEFVDLRNYQNLNNAMREVDGILIPGGADIDPEYYLNSVTTELREYTKNNLHLVKFSDEGKKRDSFEYSLIKNYSENQEFKTLPMLGICRGMQMMSVVQGIPLYLDIKTELGISNRYNRFDKIETDSDSDSLMQTLYQNKHLHGFKLHHQGIRVPYYFQHKEKFPLTKVSAFSSDGKIAEAIEYLHRPALGVQFHPERSFPEASKPLFIWFLNKACEKKVSVLTHNSSKEDE